LFQILVVDFEYASPNPAAFDIANHFHEWTANYHGDTPAFLDSSLYPELDERLNFYRAYLEATIKLNWINRDSDTPTPPAMDTPVETPGTSSDSFSHLLETPRRRKRGMSSASIISIDSIHERSFSRSGRHVELPEEDINLLEEQVRRWSPASHAMWAVWGVVQARENVERAKAGGRLDGEEDGDVPAGEFEYLAYAKGRFEAFRREVRALGAL
jgi:choline kinase